VRRNRTAVLAASAVVLMLFALAITMTVQTIRHRQKNATAPNREAAAAKIGLRLSRGTLQGLDPSEARGNTVTARQILDQGVRQIDSGLATQP